MIHEMDLIWDCDSSFVAYVSSAYTPPGRVLIARTSYFADISHNTPGKCT